MTPELSVEVVKTAPGFYASVVLECGDGWAGLLKDLGEFVSRRGPNMRAVRVMKKLGELRVFTAGAPMDVVRKIEEITERAAYTCEECGTPGTQRPCGFGDWGKTLCDKCYSGE